MANPAPAADKADLLRAFDYCLSFFQLWNKEGRLRDNQFRAVADYYDEERKRLNSGQATAEPMRLLPASVCWNCRNLDGAKAGYCLDCGAPVQSDEVQRLHYLVFLCHEIKKHERVGRLGYQAMHDLMRECNERVAAMRRMLDGKRLAKAGGGLGPAAGQTAPPVLEVADEPRRERPRRPRYAPAARPAVPARSFLEIVLDPRSIAWLLASGGVLLVVGLIIWLWTQEIDPLAIAVVMGIANAAMLVAGWYLVAATRFQTAGRALTLLACLEMPLNLWLYYHFKLVTFDEGHHLWVGALVCCLLYAVSARLVKDSFFVPVLVGGVTLTGLLMLADKGIGRFFEIIGPSTLLVAIGLVCIHAERAFAEGDGPFPRRRFGLAFFWAGHAVLAAGLLLLLGAEIYGWLVQSLQTNDPDILATVPEVATLADVKLLAILLTLAGSYAYFYSDLVVRRVGVYLYFAVFTLLWAEVQIIGLFHADRAVELAILTLSVTALIANVVIAAGRERNATLARAGLPLGVFLAGMPVACGSFLHFRATIADPQLHYDLDWTYVAAMAVTAVTCRVAAILYRHMHPVVSVVYFFATGAATMAGAGGLLLVLYPNIPWENQAQVLMAIPILYVIAAWLYRGHTPERPLVWVAHAATAVMLVASLGAAFRGAVLVEGDPLNLLLAGFFAEAALFYLLAGVFRNRAFNVYLCTAMACAAAWQLLKYSMLADEYYTLVFAAAGLVFLAAYRFAPLEDYKSRLPEAAFQCGHTLLLLAFAAAALITSARLTVDTADVNGRLLLTLAALTGISLAALVLVRHQTWRQVYVATTVMLAALSVLVLTWFVKVDAARKLEIVSVSVGLLLLVAGHIGWFREQERHGDLVSVALIFGCLLAGVPLFGFVFAGRLDPPTAFDWFHTANEVGMLAVGLLLLATGAMCRLRSTTITGAVMLVLYVLTLVLYIRLPERLHSMALYLIVGGGTVFAIALVLSFYRESLLKLPEKIKRREGLFRVLSWR